MPFLVGYSAAKRFKVKEVFGIMTAGILMYSMGHYRAALYGYALPEKRPLVASMLGGAIAGSLAMLLGVVIYAFSMPGITSIAAYIDDGSNFILLLVVMVVAWVSPFVISFFIAPQENKAARV